jgi:hypothetical protein
MGMGMEMGLIGPLRVPLYRLGLVPSAPPMISAVRSPLAQGGLARQGRGGCDDTL